MQPLLLSGTVVFVTIHVAVTYLASERLNVFTALCMLSMLPALAASAFAAVIILALGRDGTTAIAWAAACFAILVLPYTGQGLWELIARNHNRSAGAKSKRGQGSNS